MELDIRTVVYLVSLVVVVAVNWGVQHTTVGYLRGKVEALGKKFDKHSERENNRYRKVGMALTAMRMTLPASNPHGAELSKLVDSLADENGDT